WNTWPSPNTSSNSWTSSAASSRCYGLSRAARPWTACTRPRRARATTSTARSGGLSRAPRGRGSPSTRSCESSGSLW
ncbi:jg2375, partial [Pararge aegeria aegeria]